jgi:plasmid stability protein
VNISDDLLAEVKVRAQRAHRTIGDLLDDALRAYLSEETGEGHGMTLPRFEYAGGITVDLYDKDALDEVLSRALS